ncbi:hypothetical protein KR51_00030510 [Rubidibacter lacunae KORDI 51-2]|uniref:Uncharacterized protein n=1 Tax=Rubidibacter lacunae KORDI 51-2 TaxID=582515 RepID=U5DIT1_9CHRO|nr:hypothetical protein KR51_00030510 [Rubidibacter lacunae KORDI 51-2]
MDGGYLLRKFFLANCFGSRRLPTVTDDRLKTLKTTRKERLGYLQSFLASCELCIPCSRDRMPEALVCGNRCSAQLVPRREKPTARIVSVESSALA